MSKENTIRAKRLPDGSFVQVLPDGTTRPFPPDQTDWAALRAMTDEEIIEKFKSMAGWRLKAGRMDELIETVFRLDTLEDIGTLNRQMVFGEP